MVSFPNKTQVKTHNNIVITSARYPTQNLASIPSANASERRESDQGQESRAFDPGPADAGPGRGEPPLGRHPVERRDVLEGELAHVPQPTLGFILEEHGVEDFSNELDFVHKVSLRKRPGFLLIVHLMGTDVCVRGERGGKGRDSR